jgi:hypothetical protein
MITSIICRLFPDPEKRDVIANFIYNNIKLLIIIKVLIRYSIVAFIFEKGIRLSAKIHIQLLPLKFFNYYFYSFERRTFDFPKEINPTIDFLNNLFNIPKTLQ